MDSNRDGGDKRDEGYFEIPSFPSSLSKISLQNKKKAGQS